jgi:hypothetical protein
VADVDPVERFVVELVLVTPAFLVSGLVVLCVDVPVLCLVLVAVPVLDLLSVISLFFQEVPCLVCQLLPFFLYTFPLRSVYTLFFLSVVAGLLYEERVPLELVLEP